MQGMPEFMGYDRTIGTFSPDGRLFQVEYAREAVKRGTTSLGLLFSDGVILAAVKHLPELALPNSGSDKVHQIDDHLGAAISGFLADGRTLVEMARIKAQIYGITYSEPMNVSGIVGDVANRMQLFTQYGGVRPFGVALLIAGVDEKGPQLFEIDPSSAFYSWKAQVIGRGGVNALKILKKDWKEKLSKEDAIKLALTALKAGEKGIKPSEVEIAILTKDKFTKYYGTEGAKFIKKYW